MSKKTAQVTLTAQEVEFAFGPYLTLEATVVGDDEAMPTGMVCFQGRGGAVLGNAQVNEGVARLKYSGFEAGTHKLFAVYSGDDNYDTANSNVVDHVPSKPTPPKPKLTHPAIKTIPAGEKQPSRVPEVPDTREFEFEVDLMMNLSGALPDSRENLLHIVRQRQIGIPGVGNKRHGDRFKVPADLGERILKSHSDFLKLVSKG